MRMYHGICTRDMYVSNKLTSNTHTPPHTHTHTHTYTHTRTAYTQRLQTVLQSACLYSRIFNIYSVLICVLLREAPISESLLEPHTHTLSLSLSLSLFSLSLSLSLFSLSLSLSHTYTHQHT